MRVASMLLSLAGTLIAGGLIGATLVRFAPGYEVDEREQDLRLSEQSIAAIRAETGTGTSLPQYYYSFLIGLVRGDFGISRAQRRPVAEIIRERIPVTIGTAGLGCVLALLLGFGVATLSLLVPALHLAVSIMSGLLLSIPAAVIGFLVLWTGIGVEWAVASALTPKVFRYCVEILAEMQGRGHVLIARAKGLSQWRILFAHILRPAMSELTALTGVIVSLAFGVTVPLEVICDVPGLGQLAWQAALARDLPVLVTLTLLITLVVKAAHLAADSVRAAFGEDTP